MKEQELLEKGWEKETLTLHIQEYDPMLATNNKMRRLSYNLDKSFTSDQIALIERFLREVNRRFPNIKLCATGTGYIQREKDVEEPVQDETVEA